MARSLQPALSLTPALFGLNTYQSDFNTDPRFAAVLTNYVYDSDGNLAKKFGVEGIWSEASPDTPHLTDSADVFEYIDASGSSLIIYVTNNQLISDAKVDISGTTTEREWKLVNFNGWCVGHHPDYAPIQLSTVGGTFALAGGTQYNGTDVLASNGRLWIIDGNTLRYSDLLINSFAGGSSGSFDLAKYWPDGMDEAIALTEWNDYLIVFGKRSMIVYENPDDPTNSMAIVDTITGVGCIARDSIQSVGSDIFFLSSSGLRSLGRVIQEKSLPIHNISKNVASSISNSIIANTGSVRGRIRSVYSEVHQFYILSFQGSQATFVFDLSRPLDDGSLRVTKWNDVFTGMTETREGQLICCVRDLASPTTKGYESHPGYYGGVNGDSFINKFYDNRADTFETCSYQSVKIDFDGDTQSNYKILKNIDIFIDTGEAPYPGPATVAWGDEAEIDSISVSLSTTGVSEYFTRIKTPLKGSVIIFYTKITSPEFNGKFVLKKINVKAKLGRLV